MKRQRIMLGVTCAAILFVTFFSHALASPLSVQNTDAFIKGKVQSVAQNKITLLVSASALNPVKESLGKQEKGVQVLQAKEKQQQNALIAQKKGKQKIAEMMRLKKISETEKKNRSTNKVHTVNKTVSQLGEKEPEVLVTVLVDSVLINKRLITPGSQVYVAGTYNKLLQTITAKEVLNAGKQLIN